MKLATNKFFKESYEFMKTLKVNIGVHPCNSAFVK